MMLVMVVEGGLSAAERRVWEAFPAGTLVEFGTGKAEDDDPASGEGWGPDRQVRAEVLAELLCGAVEVESGQIGEVYLDRACIIGKLGFPGAAFKYGLRLHQCYVADGIDLSDAAIRTLDLESCHVGVINLLRAKINGTFSLRGAVLDGKDETALYAAELTVTGDALCDEGFKAIGPITLGGANIGGRASFSNATFDDLTFLKSATFGSRASFDSAAFGNYTSFDSAAFGNYTSFKSATFGNGTSFSNATFGDNASFYKTTFGNETFFHSATFGNRTHFSSATFGARTYFDSAAFGSDASFDSATFGAHTYFDSPAFGNDASFKSATFGDNAFFKSATFGNYASFYKTTFGDDAWLGVSGSNLIILQSLQMGRGGSIQVKCSQLDMSSAMFPDGVTVLVQEAEVTVDFVSFGGASIMAAFWPSEHANDRVTPGFIGRCHPAAPRLLSLAGCDVTHLTVNGVDLRPCRFAGTYNLEQLRLGGGTVFARQPTARRWTRRLVLAEEHAWRATYEPGRRSLGWYPLECRAREEPKPDRQPAERHSPAARTAAGIVESIYRALRKGLEDVKDEPGAADFYYGEMEMRRHAASRYSVERALLFIYWLVAGYGLRASRALATLLLVLALATVGFVTVGFAQSTTTAYQQVTVPTGGSSYEPREIRGARPGWAEAATYSVQSTTSLLRAPATEPLTESGRVIEIVLRLLGPVLLGLAILAVRGRVKR
jgi:hypothetical protein